MDKFVIGVDYGTDSVRSILVNTSNGNEIATSVFYYPRWKEGKYCRPLKNQFRQHPLDYIGGLESTVKDCLKNADTDVIQNIVALTIDTTGSTIVAVDKTGEPLSLKPEFAENPNAMFILWKDHTAVKEADEINDLAKNWKGTDFTMYEGGVYSSEWFWAKILHILRQDKQIREKAFSWVEHCDWLPALLTGDTDPLTLKRSRCAAGHKAMWHTDWEGLPSEEFLTSLDPMLSGMRDNLYEDTYTSDIPAGTISIEWADRLGLPQHVKIGVGAFDAHLGAVGAEIKPYYISKVMGTSTCDMLIAPKDDIGANLIKGICGQVDGSITPGFIGLEAGQSAFGDIYAWFRKVLMWPVKNLLSESTLIDAETKEKLIEELYNGIIPELSKKAAQIPLEETTVLALDWMNGRRTPDANQLLKGAITGLTLGSDAPRIFRALVESTAFGTKAIVERFREEGVRIDGVIALGGVAKKSTFVMQTVADVLDVPIKVAKSEQACALGAAMMAAVVGGVYPDVKQAQNNMGSGIENEFFPNKENAKKYQERYQNYLKLGSFIESYCS